MILLFAVLLLVTGQDIVPGIGPTPTLIVTKENHLADGQRAAARQWGEVLASTMAGAGAGGSES